MLKSLFIRNFVLIDSLDIKFDKGFSVITGETGAGKSIILGALSLVLGQRADGKSIKNGSEKCVIEAVFDVSRYKLEEFFLTNKSKRPHPTWNRRTSEATVMSAGHFSPVPKPEANRL